MSFLISGCFTGVEIFARVVVVNLAKGSAFYYLGKSL